MWYKLLIFVVGFQIIISIVAAYFPALSTSTYDYTESSINTTSDAIGAGLNPLETFGNVMSFQIQGAEWLGFLFWFLNVFILGVLLIRLIRGNN